MRGGYQEGLDEVCNGNILHMASVEQRNYNMNDDEYIDEEDQVDQTQFGPALLTIPLKLRVGGTRSATVM